MAARLATGIKSGAEAGRWQRCRRACWSAPYPYVSDSTFAAEAPGHARQRWLELARAWTRSQRSGRRPATVSREGGPDALAQRTAKWTVPTPRNCAGLWGTCVASPAGRTPHQPPTRVDRSCGHAVTAEGCVYAPSLDQCRVSTARAGGGDSFVGAVLATGRRPEHQAGRRFLTPHHPPAEICVLLKRLAGLPGSRSLLFRSRFPTAAGLTHIRRCYSQHCPLQTAQWQGGVLAW